MGNVSKKNVVKNESGITLMILIITVIVMSILLGATIISITGKEGIINQTRYAVNKADEDSVIDDTQIALTKLAQQWDGNGTIQRYIIGKIRTSGDTGYKTANDATITIDRVGFITYVDKNNEEFIFDDDETKKMKVDENGKVVLAECNGHDIDNLKVGDVVSYTPSGTTYVWRGKYATIATVDANGATEDDVTLDSTSNGTAKIVSWKVLDIDEATGKVKMVPAAQPSANVRLFGANGYNNAVYLLNEACKTLYSNESLGITDVRSINAEDIESVMDPIKLAEAKGEGYPVSMKNAWFESERTYGFRGTTKLYPLIYEREKKSVIDYEEKSVGLDISEQDRLYERDSKSTMQFESDEKTAKSATLGYLDATTSIKPYHTLYGLYTLPNCKDVAYYLVLAPANNSYWVASRSVYIDLHIAYFYVRRYSNGYMDGTAQFNSNNTAQESQARSLFPVVTLDFGKISGNLTDGWSVN